MVCPKCSCDLKFLSFQTTQNICANCTDASASDSLIQIGTEGEMKGEKFKVIGCRLLVGEDIKWFEWLILFETTDLAVIRELQGTWSIFTYEAPKEEDRSFDFKSVTAQESFRHLGQKYFLNRTQKAQVGYQVGESLLKWNLGDETQILEATDISTSKMLLHFELIHHDSIPIISRGEFVEFADLKFKNLRSIESGKRIQKITCPNCSGFFLVRYPSFSRRVVCSTCLNIIDMSTDDHISVGQFNQELNWNPAISIGSQGKILGENFEVIGQVDLESDKPGEKSILTQYLLFSSRQSYRWLTEENGHWTISRVVRDLFWTSKQEVTYRGQDYTYDHSAKLRVKAARGEFYWPLYADEIFESDHLISPPYDLSSERVGNQTTIYLGRYLSPRQISSAFHLAKTLTPPTGSVPHEVSFFHHIVKEFLFINLIFALACFFVQLKSVRSAPIKAYHSMVRFDDPESTQSTEPFEVRGVPSALLIKLTAKNPRYIKMSLTDIRSKKKYLFHTNRSQSYALLPHIPSGVYFLSFSRVRLSDSVNLQDSSFDVDITYGAKSWSNFYLAALILSLPSFFIFGMDQLFEFKRKRAKK